MKKTLNDLYILKNPGNPGFTLFIALLCIFVIFWNSSGCSDSSQLDKESPDLPQASSGKTFSATSSLGITRGGMSKTASGHLKVLVVFVRFKDDLERTPYWPDYRKLPDWANNYVDNSIPRDRKYKHLNMSNFFDRASGGDGNGKAGVFQVTGDVVYVTTDGLASEYKTDGEVNMHILAKLDNPKGGYNIDFRKYDNWQFMKNGKEYQHEYIPFDSKTGKGGDGRVDQIFICYRGRSKSINAGGYSSLFNVSFRTNDNRTVNTNSGVTIINTAYGGEVSAMYGPAHEYGHYLFGGFGNVDAHIDGRVSSNPNENIGNVGGFALMLAETNRNMSAFERYHLGWLEPKIIRKNEKIVTLEDTHVKNEAVLLPIKYDENGNLKEYFIIENFQTLNDYSQANPFNTTQLFDNKFKGGLLVFHIEDENLKYPTMSRLDIECADGRWQWRIAAGGNTDTQNDDQITKGAPDPVKGFDERDYIFIQSGKKLARYMALRRSDGSNNPNWSYSTSDFLGDNEDFFRMDGNKVFAPWTNPSTKRRDGSDSNVGFRITGYNSSSKTYNMEIAINRDGLKQFSR